MYTGPNITNDEIRYGYDSAYGVANNNLGTKFYPGEPTTNYADDTVDAQGGWSGSYSLIDSATKKFRFNVSNFNGSAGSGQGWRCFVWDMRAHAGSAVTISATVEVPDDSPGDFAWIMIGQSSTGSSGTASANYHGYSAASERYQKSTKSTERITWSGTIGNTGTANQPNGYIGFTIWYNGGTSGTNSYIDISNIQIEKISHATPFVNGSRSNTASLIDLKQSTNIDVSNLSFNSTAQPTFDGTDDHVDTGLTRGDLGDSFTLIAYYKFTGSTSRTYTPIFGGNESSTEFFIGKNTGNTNIGVQDGNYSGSFVTGSNAWDGNYHQIVYTYQLVGSSTSTSGTGKIYLDGVLKSTGSFTKCNTAEQIRVGHESESGGYRFIGDIPRACIYKRALSAEEVMQDFNAHKKRFNI